MDNQPSKEPDPWLMPKAHAIFPGADGTYHHIEVCDAPGPWGKNYSQRHLMRLRQETDGGRTTTLVLPAREELIQEVLNAITQDEGAGAKQGFNLCELLVSTPAFRHLVSNSL